MKDVTEVNMFTIISWCPNEVPLAGITITIIIIMYRFHRAGAYGWNYYYFYIVF